MSRKSFLFPLTGILLMSLMLTALVNCAQPAQAPQPTLPAQPTQAPPTQKTLTVFAAASLTESFTEIGKQFEAENPGVKVMFNFAGSQQLRAQLAQGARADVFAAANAKEMTTAIISDSLVVSETQRTSVTNRLTIILPKSNPGRITTLADLARPGLKLDNVKSVVSKVQLGEADAGIV